MDSWMSYVDFLWTDSACLSHHELMQFVTQLSVHEATTWSTKHDGSSSSLLSSTLLALVDLIPCGNPAGSLCTYRQQSSPYIHDAAGPAMAKQTLWTLEERSWSGSMPHWRYRAQNSPLAPTRMDNSAAALRRENLPTTLTLILVATAASLVTTPVHLNCWGHSRASQMVRKLPHRRSWLLTNTPGYCYCYIPSNRW